MSDAGRVMRYACDYGLFRTLRSATRRLFTQPAGLSSKSVG